MQEDHHQENPKIYASDGSHLDVDEIYWQELAARDLAALCNFTFFEYLDQGRLQFRFLNEEVQIDLNRNCLRRNIGGRWSRSDDPLLTLVTVMYLKKIDAVYPLGKDIVGVKDLKEGHFFAGPHELRIDPLVRRFGYDGKGFRQAGVTLGGLTMDMADVAFRLLPFPRVPLYYLIWTGDDEFEPRIQVLFDRSIEKSLAADAIWALVNRVTMALCPQ